jgi:ankyrin repeat protein
MHFIKQSSLLIFMRATVMFTALTVSITFGGCTFFMEEPGTPLARAAHEGNIDQIRALLAAGANPNEYDASNQTALHWAARGGHPFGPHFCHGEVDTRSDVVSALIDGGADVNAVDRRGAIPGGSSGWTPLHVALHHEQFNTALVLLKRGANPNIRSHQGASVMAMAAEEGAPTTLLQELLARGFAPRSSKTARP